MELNLAKPVDLGIHHLLLEYHSQKKFAKPILLLPSIFPAAPHNHLLFIVTSVIRQPNMTSSTASSRDEALAATERLVHDQTEQNFVPGIQHIIVDRDFQQAEMICSGVADKSQPDDATIDSATLFMAYSCTKVVTAVAILQLVDQGKLKLEDSLTQYYTDHPYGNKVTIQMLLSHASGVPNSMPLDWFVTEDEPLESNQYLQTILAKNNKLKFEPGSQRLYTNLGYWLLEKCIEGASQLSYADYIQQHILDLLHISKEQATFDLPPRMTANNNDDESQLLLATGHLPKWTLTTAVFYLISPKRYWIQPSKDGKWSRFARLRHFGQAYGGLYCTVTCFGKILKDLLSDSSTLLLTKETRQRLMVDPDLGGFVTGTLNGVTYYGKQGGGFGFHGNIRLYPAIGIATAFLANSTEVSEGPIDARANIIDSPIVVFKKSKTKE